MKRYRGTAEEDWAIAMWWLDLVRTGDIKRTVLPRRYAMAPFFGLFQPPATLWYETGADGRIVFASWFVPFWSGVLGNLWASSAQRSHRRAVACFEACLEWALRQWPVVLGLTWQPHLIRGHERMGYRVVGEVPHLADGEPAILLVLTREGFAERPWARRFSVESRRLEAGVP